MNMTEAAASINMLEDTLKTMKYLYQRIAELEKEKETGSLTYTVKQIARLLQVSESKAYDLMRLSKEVDGIGGFQVGDRWLVLKADFDEWVERTKGKSR